VNNNSEFSHFEVEALHKALCAVELGEDHYVDEPAVTTALLAVAHILLLRLAKQTACPAGMIILGMSMSIMMRETVDD